MDAADYFDLSLEDPDAVVRTSDEAMDSLVRQLQDIARKAFARKVERTVTEFAEKNIELKAENGESTPGPYRQSNNPIARVPQDAMGDIEVREVVLIACAQGGKSRSLSNYVGSKIVDDPENMIVAYPAESTAMEKAKTDFFPMFRAVDAIKERVFDAAEDKWDKTTLMNVRYPGGNLKFPTTASPTQTASTPSGIAIIDEYSRAKDTQEGDPRAALLARMGWYLFYKLIVASTLVGKNCRTARAYRETDMSVPVVTCPSCGHVHQFKFENIDIAREVITEIDHETKEVKEVEGEILPHDSAFRCPSCSYRIPDGIRWKMIDDVKWLQTRPFTCCGKVHKPVEDGKFIGPWDEEGICICPKCEKRPRGIKDKRGFKWPAYYVKRPLSDIVQRFKESLGNPVLLRQFWNDWDASEWEIESSVADSGTQLAARAISYDEAYGQQDLEVPEPVIGLFASIDVNPSYGLDMNIRGFGPEEESWGVHYEKILGDVTDLSKEGPWYRADELRRRLWRGVVDEDGGLRVYRVLRTLVDINDPASVQFARAYVMPRIGKGVLPIKGRAPGPLWNPDASIVGRHTDPHFPIGTIAGKTLISARLRVVDQARGRYNWPAEMVSTDGAVHSSHGYSDRYFEELANLKRRPNRSMSNGSPDVFYPEKTSIRQEAWDTEVYILAALKGYLAERKFTRIEQMPRMWRYRNELEIEQVEADQENDARPESRRLAVARVKETEAATPPPSDPRSRGDRI